MLCFPEKVRDPLKRGEDNSRFVRDYDNLRYISRRAQKALQGRKSELYIMLYMCIYNFQTSRLLV